MPIWARSSYISRGESEESGRPKTRISPESGVRRPLASFMMTLLPTPAGPRRMRISPWQTVKETSRRTGPRSKAMETRENSTTGVLGSRAGRRGAVAVVAMCGCVVYEASLLSDRNTEVLRLRLRMTATGDYLSSEDADHHLGDQEVEEDDEHGADDDGLGGGAADALCAAGRAQAAEAADGGDDETGEERLGEAFKDVAKDE